MQTTKYLSNLSEPNIMVLNKKKMGQEIECKKLDGNNFLGGRLFITGIDRGIYF